MGDLRSDLCKGVKVSLHDDLIWVGKKGDIALKVQILSDPPTVEGSTSNTSNHSSIRLMMTLRELLS